MKNICWLACLTLFTLLAAGAPPARAVLPDERGPTDAVAVENAPEFVELFRVRFENKPGGIITISSDAGATWESYGRVLMPAGYLNKEGYTASGWAPRGRVAATAVNAVHLKVRQNGERGVLLSLLPADYYEEPEDYNSYYSRNTSIITDIPAGTGFFGGGESPFVGSPVLLERGGADPVPLPEMYYPEEGDAITVVVERPVKYPVEIEFENRFGGFITVTYHGGEKKIIAQVLRPAYGVGRFGGSLHTGVGRIRANHTGVICISTSPPGEIGGLQVIPENHAMSPEMVYARLLTQWMVVGPPGVRDPSLEGVAPLFRYFIRPVYYAGAAGERTLDEMLASFIVQVRLNGGDWERMPEFTGRQDEALKDMTHLRILFPMETPGWLE